jgi:hypothetical protein
MQAVGLVYKRSEPGEDPPEWNIREGTDASGITNHVYKLLHRIRRIPGTAIDGAIDTKKLSSWIQEVRGLARKYSRQAITDRCVGELLSKSTSDVDGIWPAIPIREVLEELGSKAIADAMRTGLYNQRGAHFRDVGGKQERELATKYREWAKKTRAPWPFTSRLLDDIAAWYDREAQWQDTNADLNRRMVR